jgi:NodT family efflux transporter outer membrane factor (OMF) lipoprotein/GxxExxY protein
MRLKFKRADEWSRKVIGAAIEVHRVKGPGLLEPIYEKCLMRELFLQNIPTRNQLIVPIEYKGHVFEEPLRLDIYVDDCLIVELKAVEEILPIHKAQLLSYMKLLDAPLGLLINFHEMKLVDGLHRLILPGADGSQFGVSGHKGEEKQTMNPSSLPSFASVRGMAVLACVLAALVSGCKLASPPSRSHVLTNALPTTTRIPPRWDSPADTNAVADDWLKSFNDARLDALVGEAITNNLDLRAAAARVEAARQLVVVVGSQLLPQVGAKFGAGATRDDGHDDWGAGTTAYLGAAWEPDIWGKLRAQKAATEAGYEAAALDYAWGRQSLAATTAKTWYLAVETRQLVSLAEQVVGIYSQLLDLVKIRRATGKVTDLDVAEAGASLNTAQSQLRAVQATESEVKRVLELLLGRYPAAEIAVAINYAPVPPPVRAGLPASLLERRPDILAAERTVLATFRGWEAARLALLPSFTLGIEGGRLENNLLSLLQLNPWLFRSAVGMTIPIYTGGELTARIKIATARQQAAVAAYGGTVLLGFREVENALTNEGLFAQRVEFDQAALRDRTEAVRISRIQYTAGATDLLSLLQLQADQIATDVAVIKLRNAQLANRINLHLALGGGFENAPAVPPGFSAQAAGGSAPDK